MTASDKDMRDPGRDEVIAGEYVLGVLSAEDRRKVEARLASDRNFAAMVNRWEENLSTFNDDYDTLSAPPGVFAAVENRLFETPARDAMMAGTVAGGFWNSLAFWRSMAFASIAIAAGFAITGSGLLSQKPAGKPLMAALSGEGSAINLMARYDDLEGSLHITPVAAGNDSERSLELWLVEGDKAPVSLGVLPQTGEGVIAIPAEMRGRITEGAVLAVSVEPFGGSPTGSATGPVIASGAARSF
jgi:anti-sigma-K factor RskA